MALGEQAGGGDDGSLKDSDDAVIDDEFQGSRDVYALPVLVGISILLVSLLTSMVLRNSENRALESAVDSALNTVSTEIEQGIDRQLYGMIILAWKWDWQEGRIREEWVSEARGLIEETPLLSGIEWRDADFALLVREPDIPGGSLILGVQEHDEVLEMAELANRERRLVGAVVESPEDERILMVHLALYRQGEHKGYAFATYGLNSLLSNIFVSEPEGFRVEVSDANGAVWASEGETPADVPIRRAVASSLRMQWDVAVSPGVALVARYRTWLPFAIGLGGAFVGLLTALALYMGVDSRRKAHRLAAGNLRLRDEMTLRDRAEKARAETESELVDTLNSLPVHVWSATVSEDGEYESRRMSTVLSQISGRPSEFFAGGRPEDWLEIVHPEDKERLAEIVSDVIGGQIEEIDFEYRLVRTDGAIRHMSDSVRATHTEQRRRLDGVSRDVTEVKKSEEERLLLEARFQRAQRLESLGVLAGGIAHDFNNLLVAMLGHARLAETDLPPESPVHQNLKSVVKAARQAGELCGQMLAYAGKVPIVTALVELEEIVEEMGELLRASIPASTFIRYSFDKEVPPLQGDASQIRQVTLNLITNASEAIGEGGGEISLAVQSLKCTSEDLSEMEFSEGLMPGQYAALTVTDTGSGMDDATRKKIFEPFYTTKFTGRGLGMAAVVGIVRAHGGAIRIETEVGQGSSISVFFPAASEQGSRTDVRPESEPSPLWKGMGKVLLVEDEDSARELARIVLERAGLEVVEAADGLEAMAIFRTDPELFSCVLLDLTMPNMDGVETYSRLRAIRPDLRVILCSGYPEHAAMARFADLGLAGFLKKPYEPEELLKCLQSLDAPVEFESI